MKITIYLKDSGENQNNEQGKSFSGSVTFYAAGGDTEGVTAIFGEETETKERTSLEMLDYLGLSSKGTRTDFSSVATTDEGIYSAPDDYGTSYYFRGAAENNYVKFAGYYWRIIRINGNGTIRMIYDGTSGHTNGESSTDRKIGTSGFNFNKYDDNAYVGFMYGSIGQSGEKAYENTHANINDSTIKGALDTWYSGLTEENKNYIADSLFCGDRTIISGTGAGKSQTVYGARYRLIDGKSPKLTCENKNDRYTVDDTSQGNGALTNPVGLITADEVAMAGGVNGVSNTNSSYYLYTGENYHTISPTYFYASGSYAYVFYVHSNGYLISNFSVHDAFGVRPVINLKSNIKFSDGNGSQGSPWVVGTGNA